jgi:hypothetical protein
LAIFKIFIAKAFQVAQHVIQFISGGLEIFHTFYIQNVKFSLLDEKFWREIQFSIRNQVVFFVEAIKKAFRHFGFILTLHLTVWQVKFNDWRFTAITKRGEV